MTATADTGSGVDSGKAINIASGSDTGSGTESAIATVTEFAAETGHGADAATIIVHAADEGGNIEPTWPLINGKVVGSRIHLVPADPRTYPILPEIRTRKIRPEVLTDSIRPE
ncbi:hypothetical protein [Nocardia jiangxiensis]|uniref:hypothetical protein n=1 Tax=Nocardia jiangxiensis TaxID=282685 RepID=UPI0002DFC01A|nr:hypothetical protein [Nocardia jiangxiensis]